MVATSTISTPLRKAVVDGLAALPGLANTKVTYTWTTNQEERQQVYTAHGTTDTPPASLKSGPNFREDEGTFRLVIDVDLPGGDGYEADAALDVLAAIVEPFLAACKTNPGLGALGVEGLQWLRLDGVENRGGPASNTYVSQRIYTVRYHARIES